MRDVDELMIHRKAKALEGTYEAHASWGRVVVRLEAVPNYAGGKGCPEEILCLRIELPAFGTLVELSAPIHIEWEKAGSSAAKLDVEKFCHRSLSREQKSYLKIPVIVVGGSSFKKLRPTTKGLLAQFNTTQVPRRIVE